MMIRGISRRKFPPKNGAEQEGKNSWPQNAPKNSDVYEFVSLRIMGSQSWWRLGDPRTMQKTRVKPPPL